METEVLEKKIEFAFPVEIRKQAEKEGEFHVMGYAATTDFDFHGDVISEEALKASSLDLLKNSTILLNHDIKKPIGKVIKVEIDKHGLLIDVLISKTEPDIIQKIKEGVLNKFSIRGHVLERDKKFMPEHDRVVNVINRMSLVEVSLVSVPANPEARAIGWYISKALEENDKEFRDVRPTDSRPTDQHPQGGETMSNEEIVIEEISKKEEETPSPEPNPPKESEKGNPEPPKTEPAPAPNPAPTEEKPKAEPPVETQKNIGTVIRAQLEPIFAQLDKLIGMGNEVGPIAQQIKTVLMRMVGETMSPAPQPVASGSMNKEDMGNLVSEEVQKQLDTALKSIPAMRKGLVQKETEKEDLSKAFNGLTPDKKLKVALALQQG